MKQNAVSSLPFTPLPEVANTDVMINTLWGDLTYYFSCAENIPYTCGKLNYAQWKAE